MSSPLWRVIYITRYLAEYGNGETVTTNQEFL